MGGAHIFKTECDELYMSLRRLGSYQSVICCNSGCFSIHVHPVFTIDVLSEVFPSEGDEFCRMVWINKLFRNCYDIIINRDASKNKWHAWFAAIGDGTMHYTLESLIAHHLHITIIHKSSVCWCKSVCMKNQGCSKTNLWSWRSFALQAEGG